MKRGLFFVFLFILGVAGIICYSSYITITSAKQQNRYEIEQSLKNSATQQAALVTVWYGAVENQILSFLAQDILRLFVSEVDSTNVSVEDLVQIPYLDDKQSQSKPKIPSKLQESIPGVQRLVEEFANRNAFPYVRFLDRELRPYTGVGTFSDLTKDEERLLLDVFNERKPRVLPIRRIDKELYVPLAYPIFAPTYVDPKGTRVVGILLLVTSVQKIVSAIDQSDAEGFFTSALLEQQQKKDASQELVLVDPLYPGGKRELARSWRVKDDKNGAKNLACDIRSVPTRAEKIEFAYTYALPLAPLPWYVMQGSTVANAESAYIRFKENVLFGTGLLLLLTVIFVIAFWWWGVGRRERAQAEELRELYGIASEQKQILDSVNSALSSAIVLNDLSGKIYYVNQKFAEMAKMDASQMMGLSADRLPKDLGASLALHTNALCEKPEKTDFQESLIYRDEERKYLTSCSPCVDDEDYLVGIVSIYNDVTDLLQAQEKARKLVSQMVQAFVAAIEGIDPYLKGQSSNTAVLAIDIAKTMGFTDPEITETLRIAALLSQIGMIQLPRELLNKTGTFTQEERALLEQHVVFAKTTLEKIDFGLPVLTAITQMYEREDGTGYPEHLTAEYICMNAKILAVANTFCALIRPRSYRRACSVDTALDILSSKQGQYSQEVLAALVQYLTTDRGRAITSALVAEK